MCTVLHAVSNDVHRFTCRVKVACIVLRAILKKDVHRFACKSKVRAPFCVQVELALTVFHAVSNNAHYFMCRFGGLASFCVQARRIKVNRKETNCKCLQAIWCTTM